MEESSTILRIALLTSFTRVVLASHEALRESSILGKHSAYRASVGRTVNPAAPSFPPPRRGRKGAVMPTFPSHPSNESQTVPESFLPRLAGFPDTDHHGAVSGGKQETSCVHMLSFRHCS